MLHKLKLHYDLSRETNKLAFYEEYLDGLREWCDHYGIESTSESIGLERMLDDQIICLKYPNT